MTHENYIYNPPNIYDTDDSLFSSSFLNKLNPDDTKTKTQISLIPSCYKNVQRPNINVELLHEETLFYIFYNLIGEKIQNDAYKELIQRNYFYHQKVDFFVMLNNPKIVDNKRHVVCFFNCYTWKKENVALWFDNEFIEALCD